MKTPFEAFSSWSKNKRALDICRHKYEAVNVMEHDGEIWVCSFGEPVVPISFLNRDASEIGEVMERCRNGWVSYKIGTDE